MKCSCNAPQVVLMCDKVRIRLGVSYLNPVLPEGRLHFRNILYESVSPCRSQRGSAWACAGVDLSRKKTHRVHFS